MRPILVAGNWKMNLTLAEAESLAAAVATAPLPADGSLRIALFPPFPHLQAVAQAIRGSAVALGAQNLYHEAAGAFTGEVSGPMLVDMGCRYVLVGHSERRHVLGETDPLIRRKLRAALAVGLDPILCVGELLEERDDEETVGVVEAQISSALAGLDETRASRLTFAYEPVWAIGTGRTATPEQAEDVHGHIRSFLKSRYNAGLADRAVIQYGGSVKPENARELMDQPNVDGLLVGGASLQAEDFLKIVHTARQALER